MCSCPPPVQSCPDCACRFAGAKRQADAACARPGAVQPHAGGQQRCALPGEPTEAVLMEMGLQWDRIEPRKAKAAMV